MEKFEVREQFYLNQQPFTIHAGAVHYFRIAPSEWRSTLMALKKAGLNTVETYIPWNVHEPTEGHFQFDDQFDITKFVKLAQQLGLYVILRPSPYICAEWEFGGLPAWLLRYPAMRVRSNTPDFMTKVAAYYAALFKVLTPLQITQGGPVIMMQVENEYGSFGNDKTYLRAIKDLMIENGVDVPLFTADGSWQQALAAGSLIEDDVLVTANFGSKVDGNLAALTTFMQAHNKQWPLMCMEFWDGWFNRWQEPIVKRSTTSFQTDLQALVTAGASFNLYMFRGGTNFGFYNGCSSRQGIDYPQVTSYDYDAVLHEDGRISDKYHAVQQVMQVDESVPVSPVVSVYPTCEKRAQVRLVDVLDAVGTYQTSSSPLTMESHGSGYGYIFYQTTLSGNNQPEKLQLLDVADRADIYLNQQYVITQYQKTLGQELTVNLLPENQLQVLVENLGRVNYGARLRSTTQQKGIRTGVMVDRHLHANWQQWFIDFKQMGFIDWQVKQSHYGPTLTKFEFDVDNPHSTYVDCRQWGKGVVLLNGINVGRYWQVGPYGALYIPQDFFKQGHNELIVFETTKQVISQLNFLDHQEEFEHA